MIQKIVQDWTHHIAKNLISHKISSVFYNNYSKINELMHKKSNNRIIMIKVRFPKENITSLNNRIKISIIVKSKISIKIKFKIFENKLDWAYIWNKPKVNVLHSIYFPMLQSRNFDWNQLVISSFSQIKRYFWNI